MNEFNPFYGVVLMKAFQEQAERNNAGTEGASERDLIEAKAPAARFAPSTKLASIVARVRRLAYTPVPMLTRRRIAA